jgi:hypothetical protein
LNTQVHAIWDRNRPNNQSCAEEDNEYNERIEDRRGNREGRNKDIRNEEKEGETEEIRRAGNEQER